MQENAYAGVACTPDTLIQIRQRTETEESASVSKALLPTRPCNAKLASACTNAGTNHCQADGEDVVTRQWAGLFATTNYTYFED